MYAGSTQIFWSNCFFVGGLFITNHRWLIIFYSIVIFSRLTSCPDTWFNSTMSVCAVQFCRSAAMGGESDETTSESSTEVLELWFQYPCSDWPTKLLKWRRWSWNFKSSVDEWKDEWIVLCKVLRTCRFILCIFPWRCKLGKKWNRVSFSHFCVTFKWNTNSCLIYCCYNLMMFSILIVRVLCWMIQSVIDGENQHGRRWLPSGRLNGQQ